MAYVERKANAGNNRQKNNPIRASRYENENKETQIKKVNKETGLIISKARASINLTQAQLAQLLSLSSNIIAKIESGDHVKDAVLLNRISQLLKVRLTGPNAGQPLPAPKRKTKQ